MASVTPEAVTWKDKLTRRDESCYMCGHSHQVMAHWSSKGETRALCHGVCDTDCYTEHNHGQTSRRWGLYADQEFPAVPEGRPYPEGTVSQHYEGTALEPPVRTVLDADHDLNSLTTEGSYTMKSGAASPLDLAPPEYLGYIAVHKDGTKTSRVLSRRPSTVEEIVGLDLARDSTPVPVPIDSGGFYHAPNTARPPKLTMESLLEAINQMRYPRVTRRGWLFYGPTEELLDRLNKTLRGEDPGPPVNWLGVEGYNEQYKHRRRMP